MKHVNYLMILILLLPLGLSAQQRSITGRVTDALDGSPLAGVSVKIASAGVSANAATNAEGMYTIVIPNDVQVLTFTFLGMQDHRETIGGEQRSMCSCLPLIRTCLMWW